MSGEARLPRGPQGIQGERGPQGTQGLSPAVRRAVVFLVLLTFLASGINLLWTAHLVRADNAAKCGYVETIATLPIPGGDITAGARRFDTQLEAAFTARAAELGCGKGTP